MTTEDALRSVHGGAVVISRYDDVNAVLNSTDVSQDDRHPHARFFEGTLLMLDGAAHAERRRLETALFRRSALNRYEADALEPAIESALEWARSETRTEGALRTDLVRLVRIMLHRIAAATTGLDVGESLDETLGFIRCIEELMEGVEIGFDRRDTSDVLDRAQDALTRFREGYFEPSLARRRSARLPGSDMSAGPDLITTLMSSGLVDDEELMLREAVLYVLAATVTTTRSVPHLFHHLHEWWVGHVEDRRLAGDVQFLRAAAAESLRLHPTTPAVHRRAITDFETPSGLRIAAGSLMLVTFAPANRDPARFGPDADNFDPHRTLDSSQPGYGLAFGAGSHVCIGRGLAMGTSRSDPPHGTIVRIMLALNRLGAAPDPAAPPTTSDDRLYDELLTYPIILGNV